MIQLKITKINLLKYKYMMKKARSSFFIIITRS